MTELERRESTFQRLRDSGRRTVTGTVTVPVTRSRQAAHGPESGRARDSRPERRFGLAFRLGDGHGPGPSHPVVQRLVTVTSEPPTGSPSWSTHNLKSDRRGRRIFKFCNVFFEVSSESGITVLGFMSIGRARLIFLSRAGPAGGTAPSPTR